MTTRIQIVSDLHLEFGEVSISNLGAEVLVMAGDIVTAEYFKTNGTYAKRFRHFLANVNNSFERVVYIAGNHEHYGGGWDETHDILANECAKYGNIRYLNNSSVCYAGIMFVGGTMWTDMNRGCPLTQQVVKDGLNDYRHIRDEKKGYRKITPAVTINAFNRTVATFKELIRTVDSKVVVVSHHAPSYASIHENYRTSYHMNGGYASDLSEFILDNPKIALWIHGHMHDPFDYMIGDTRIICNPAGYPANSHENPLRGGKVVEI